MSLAFVFEKLANEVKDIIFASLAGIFLYTSLSTFIPLLEKLMTEKRRKTRVALAMLAFISAILIIQRLIYLKKDLKKGTLAKTICWNKVFELKRVIFSVQDSPILVFKLMLSIQPVIGWWFWSVSPIILAASVWRPI